MVDKPTILPKWASEDVLDPISQQWNVVQPPDEKKTDGWFLGEKPNRQWWNWFQRQTYLWLQWLDQQESSNVTTDETGKALFPVDNAQIEITAVDLDDSTLFYKAVGIKMPGLPPQFAAGSVDSSGLSLGVGTVAGDQPILGGANVVVTGRSTVIPT